MFVSGKGNPAALLCLPLRRLIDEPLQPLQYRTGPKWLLQLPKQPQARPHCPELLPLLCYRGSQFFRRVLRLHH